MQETLRPMSTSQVLDRTFYLYRRNFLLFAGIAILPPGLIMVGQLLMLVGIGPLMQGAGGMGGDPTIFMTRFGLGLLGFVGFLALAGIGYAFASGASVCAVSRVHLGQRSSITEAYRLLGPHMGRILGIVILLGLGTVVVVGLVALIIAVPLVGSFRAGGNTFNGAVATGIMLAFLLGFVVFIMVIFLSTKFALSVPACVVENLGVIDSLRRSWKLTEGTFWRLILIVILTAVMSMLLSLVLSIPYFIGVGLVVVRKDPTMLTPFVVWQYVAEFLARTVAFPVSTIAPALIYYDQRVRKEAFDLQLMMEAVGQSTSPPPPLANQAFPGMG